MNKRIGNNERKLRIALLGCGKMGSHHLNVINRMECAELVGIAEPRISADKYGTKFGKKIQMFSSAEELLKKRDADVIHIVTPPISHYKLGKLALENNSHVFIEKPFVMEERQAEELIEIAIRKGLRICAGHQLLAQNATRLAEGALEKIGEIVHVESYFAFRKIRKSVSMVDQLIDILPHPVYTMLHFMGHRRDQNENSEIWIREIEAEARGEVRAIIEKNGCKGVLIVSLRARPVDSYLKIVGTNGAIHIDYVRGVVINLSGAGADAISAIVNPYRHGWQIGWKTTKALAKMAVKKNGSYEGLAELIENFYRSILKRESPLISEDSIIQTVNICEKIGTELKKKERKTEGRARERLEEKAKGLPPTKTGEYILVTGGNGFLGRSICGRLRSGGWPVKSVSRSLPRFSDRDPGIEYSAFDLAEGIPPDALKGASVVIHCAAETSGGKEDHQRNSIDATRKVIESAAAAGIKKVIHISSLGVLKPGRNSRSPLDEKSPVDHDNMSRGPYVWGKAKAEEVAGRLGKELGLNLKIIRPGPLVDFEHFEAPGRLGREVGTYFVVMGSKKSPLSVCNVHTVAKVIECYLNHYDSAPPLLNLVEPDALSRKNLILKLFERRKDLKALYVPTMMVNVTSSILKVIQKIVFPSRKAIDIAAAFGSEKYNCSLVKEVIAKTPSN